MPDDTERLVDEALEAGILRQNGPHFYAVREEEDDEYVGQGADAALEWLEEEGYVETGGAQEGAAEESEESAEEEDEDLFGAEDSPEDTEESSDEGSEGVFNPDGIYRFEGDVWTEVEREGRAPALLHPGASYHDLPNNPAVRDLIEEGLLVDITS